jgi:hypothetical protein
MKKIALAATAALVMAGCTPEWARENDSNLLMRITDIEGQPGSEDQDAGDVLLSDVCCPIINDIAVVEVELFRKNPLATSVPVEDVVLTRYEVRYFRTDGHNTEGVDVPYRITGPLSARIHAPSLGGESSAEVAIDVVRHQAKTEPPLSRLRNISNIDPGGISASGASLLTVIAEITVYGETGNDRSLTATGQLQITFANYGGDETD